MLAIKKRILQSNLKKSGNNKFAKFKYYELQDIVPTIVTLCEEYGVYTEFSFTEKLGILRISDAEIEEGKEREITVPMAKAEIKGCNEVQLLGGSITYLKRYLLMNAFDITENDHFDGLELKPEYSCADCGTKFEDKIHTTIDNIERLVTAEYQFKKSESAFGRALCKECRELGGFYDAQTTIKGNN